MSADITAVFARQLTTDLADRLPQLYVTKVVMGLFFTAVQLNDGSTGLCATPLKSIPQAVCCPSSLADMPLSGKLQGRPVGQLLEDLTSRFALRRCLALAALNACVAKLATQPAFFRNTELLAGDTFEHLSFRPTDKVVLVGAFAPYMKKLRHNNIAYKVLELDKAVLKSHEMANYVAPENAAPAIAAADTLIITGTTLLNDSLSGLLQPAGRNCQIAVVGPTAPLYPQVWQQLGVNYVGSVLVTDAAKLMAILAEGGSGYHFFASCTRRVTIRLP